MFVSPIGYQSEYEVRTYEIDSHKRMTIPAITRLMQEAAMQNVIRLKLSVWDLEPENISWVLMRKQLHIFRLPVLGEQIQVMTCPAGFERMFTYRDYKVRDKNGKLLAASSSTWLLMDTNTRRMSPIPDHILAFQKQMPPPEECLPRPDGRLPRFEQAQSTKYFEVNWHDLDFNRHLNNTLYIQWLLEPLPALVLEKGMLRQLDINYRAECHWQDQVRAEVQALDEPGQFLHRLSKKEDGKELAVARTKWEG
ncbi:MAG: hypothetical protein KDD06_17385 [Phaeodactylibacter sp.]|nr:hypothetical protein [Phaeodactylibacter sp.]MCB9287866.1 acyl-ACP thioesterase [Lewinellaceae bacterium]